MTFGIYVRTGNGGTDPDYVIRDLGFRVVAGPQFSCLSSADKANPLGGDGYYTAIQVKDSYELYFAIKNNLLEWSSDGYNVQLAADYEPDALFVQQISNNTLDMSESGRLVVRNVNWFWQISNPIAGEIVLKDGYHYGFDGYTWKPFAGSGSSSAVIGGVAPPGNTGSLWLDNGILKYYDDTRAKWLASESHYIQMGRNGRTFAGSYYRTSDSMVTDGYGRSVPIRKGTITYIGAQFETIDGPTIIEVVVSGVVVAQLSCSTAGLTYSDTINVDVDHGTVSFRNASTGAATDNSQIVMGYRIR